MNLLQWADSEKGNRARLARALGVNEQLVGQWVLGKRSVPSERCVPIEVATDGAVTCEELRPDLADQFAYLRQSAEARAA